jgi:succinate dehydrogenase/fumarate reductase flavoprotein subunit
VLDFLPQWYGKPLLRSNWIWEGFDFKDLVARIKQRYAVEVAPAAHFTMGGIEINEACETTVPGLFACGEVAGGVHGANRLSGSACTQFLVQGRVAGRAAAQWAKDASEENQTVLLDLGASFLETSQDDAAPRQLLEKVHSIANAGLNVVRSSESLCHASEAIKPVVQAAARSAKDFLSSVPTIDALEARSSAVTVQAMLMSAIDRQESRGAFQGGFSGYG